MRFKKILKLLRRREILREITSAALGQERGRPLFNLFSLVLAPDFDRIFTICTEVDRELIKYVRAMTPNLEAERIRNAYQNIAERQLKAHRLSLGNIVGRFQRSQRSFTRRLNPDVRVLVETSQRSITFQTDREVVRVDEPELLWDCNRDSTADPEHRISCRIHSKPNGAKIGKLFRNRLVAIHYDGVEVLWRDLDDFWPPSIDAFHFVENLREYGVLEKPIESVLDVGAGTGFLGLWLSKHNAHVKRMYFSEWLLTPLLYATCNAIQLSESITDRKVVSWPILGMYTLWPNGHPFWRDSPVDLLVCNPPYLPLPGNSTEQWLTEAVAGTELLVYLIKHGLSYGREVYLACSDLALPEAKAAQREGGVQLIQVGHESRVPFRIPKVLRDAESMAYLKDRGLEETTGYHRYYHVVRTYRLERG